MTDTDASMTEASTTPVTVFVCSAGHSGSTLLDLLLGSHPIAMSLGEITQLPKNLALNSLCSCGAAVRQCPIWRAVVERLATERAFEQIRDDPYVLNLGLFEASTVIDHKHQTLWRHLWRRVVYAGAYAHWRWDVGPLAPFTRPLHRGARNKWLLFDVVADLVGRPILIDSSKHYLEAAALYRTAPHRTKVVLLVRDGRAVFYSGLKRGQTRRKALNVWLRTYTRAAPLLEKLVAPKCLLHVRYEDLAGNPARELQRICRFVGVTFDPSMLEFCCRPHHVVNGNDMRLRHNAAIRLDHTWRDALSATDFAYFEARGGALNRRLGY